MLIFYFKANITRKQAMRTPDYRGSQAAERPHRLQK